MKAKIEAQVAADLKAWMEAQMTTQMAEMQSWFQMISRKWKEPIEIDEVVRRL